MIRLSILESISCLLNDYFFSGPDIQDLRHIDARTVFDTSFPRWSDIRFPATENVRSEGVVVAGIAR